MVSSDFREEAREKLSGKWGKAACITLAYVFIFAVLSIIEGLFSDTIEALISIFATIAFYKFANSDNDSIEATVVDKNATEE